jgi:hypothetical protein
MVYEKSARGYTEFTNNKRTLNVRERQVLLLVNGIRDLDDLEKFFKKEHLMEMLGKLEAGGFIQRTDQALTAPESSDAKTATFSSSNDFSVASLTTMSFFQTDNVSATINAATLEAVKTILIEATDDYLGLMGRAIRTRISACDNETELRNCISSWHMAMRESKLGRESTSFLMQQIHHALENNALKDSGLAIKTYSPAITPIIINTVEANHSGNNILEITATHTMAKPGSVENTLWGMQQKVAPAQKLNTLEPLGFLQNAFG